jgi:hypothetical protein
VAHCIVWLFIYSVSLDNFSTSFLKEVFLAAQALYCRCCLLRHITLFLAKVVQQQLLPYRLATSILHRAAFNALSADKAVCATSANQFAAGSRFHHIETGCHEKTAYNTICTA